MNYVLSDLKDVKMPKNGAIFNAIDCWTDKEGKMRGPSKINIPVQDVIYVPQNQIKGWIGKKEEGEELVEVSIQYHTGVPRLITNPETKEKSEVGVLGDITFDWGILRVDPTKKRLYTYLTYCSWNKDNIHSKKNKIFFEYIADKKLLSDTVARKRKMEAMSLAFDMDLADLVEYAGSLSVSMDIINDEELLRATMSSKAEANPDDFIKNFKSPENWVRSVINQAIQLQVLENIPSTGEWNRIDEERQRILIIRAPKGKDQLDWFIQWLSKDNRGTTELIKECVDRANGGNKTKTVAAKK